MENKLGTLVAVLLFASAIELSDAEQVSCSDQQEVCTCPQNFRSCDFTLKVETLNSFTSYRLNDTGELITAQLGTKYTLDRSGYSPVTTGTPCSIPGPFTDVQIFTNNRCSRLMTLDGDSTRLTFIAINGRIPGPTLIVTRGQIMKVRVTNINIINTGNVNSDDDEYGITIHWHGMHQRGTPWMDGVGSVSQRPIPNGTFFDYNFKATPSGTHWYHSHVGKQRTGGLFGALIVREEISTATLSARLGVGTITDQPESHTLSLIDWQTESPDKVKSFSEDGAEISNIVYWSGLINGRGRKEAQTVTPLSVFRVTRHNLYRFRLIGAQNIFAYNFSIDGHTLKVIATDGHFFQPVDVKYILENDTTSCLMLIRVQMNTGYALKHWKQILMVLTILLVQFLLTVQVNHRGPTMMSVKTSTSAQESDVPL